MQHRNSRRKADSKLLNGDAPATSHSEVPEFVDHDQRDDQKEEDQKGSQDSANKSKQACRSLR